MTVKEFLATTIKSHKYPFSDENEYAEDDWNYTETVYGYVPIEVVEKLIEKHGGIKI